MITTFIKRPVFTTMFVFMLVVFGIRCYPELGVDLYPDVDLPLVSVRITYEGASPGEMETLITKPIENAVSQVSGIKTLSSVVLEGYSETVLEFDFGVDPNIKSTEVREKVSTVRSRLPDDIDEPTVQTVDLSSRAIVGMTFSSNARSRGEIRRIIEDSISDELQMVEGVAEVTPVGASNRAVKLTVRPEKLAEYNISFQSIFNKINQENYNTPGGKAKSKDMDITVRTIGKYNYVDDIKNIAIANYDGKTVYIRDVVDVEDDWEDEDTFANSNGVPCVVVLVRKQSKTNTVNVIDNVYEKLAELQKTLIPEDIKVEIVRDQSTYIRDNIADVWNAIIFGGFLAMLITYLFLCNFMATIVGSLCIPTSIISTFFMMKVMDFSLNNMSLMALSLAVGILIDDAIVLIENIFRHIEMGKTPQEAANDATIELALAILATSLTLMAVFVPIGNMGEVIGQFFKQFGLTVAMAIAFSTMTAYTLTPMVAAYFLTDQDDEQKPRNKYLDRFLKWFNDGFDSIRTTYNEFMDYAMNNQKKILIGACLTLLINVGLFQFVGTEFQPTYDSGEFTVNFKAPYGTSLEKTIELARPMQEEINTYPEVEIASLLVGNNRNPANQGEINVRLTRSTKRKRSMQEILDELRMKFRHVEGLKVTVLPSQSTGRSESRPVQIGLRGNDMKLLKNYAMELSSRLSEVPGATDVDITDSDDEPEIIIKIDQAKASLVGLDSYSVGLVVEMAFMGKETINTYTIGNNDYDIIIQMPKSDRVNINDVANLRVSSEDGQFIRLGDIADVYLSSGPTRIEREGKQRQIVVYANAVGTSAGNLQKISVEKLIPEMHMEPGYTYHMVGIARDMTRSFNEIEKAVIFAIVIVYMVLAAQFESFTQPLVIMAALPFALAGAIIGLLITNNTANIMSLIGFIMLLGLVTKNAILLVDFTNQEREAGVPMRQALLDACSLRLRPIFMTTFSTILGMMPIALAIGSGAELRQSMGVVLIGGLTTSTMLTLVVIPILYEQIEGYMERRKGRKEAARAARRAARLAMEKAEKEAEAETMETSATTEENTEGKPDAGNPDDTDKE